MVEEISNTFHGDKSWIKKLGGYNDLPKKSKVITQEEFMSRFINECFDYIEFRQPYKKHKNCRDESMGDMKMFIKKITVGSNIELFGVAILSGFGETVFYEFNHDGWEKLARMRSDTMY